MIKREMSEQLKNEIAGEIQEVRFRLATSVGSEVEGYGTLVSIHTKDGERDYMFEDAQKGIKLIPGDLLEQEMVDA